MLDHSALPAPVQPSLAHSRDIAFVLRSHGIRSCDRIKRPEPILRLSGKIAQQERNYRRSHSYDLLVVPIQDSLRE